MALDDVGESEVAVAVTAASALLFSPRVRGMLRGAAVCGLASLLAASDTAAAIAQSLGRGAAPPDRIGAGLQDIVTRPATVHDADDGVAAGATSSAASARQASRRRAQRRRATSQP